jgi:ankyrin repeat protein
LVAQGIEIKTGKKIVKLKRSLGAIIALSLAASPAPILAQGLGLNASDGEAFLKAIKDDDANKAVELASQPGTRVVNYRGYDGETPLNIVTRKRELDWVGFLLTRGADPNIADGKGDIPLTIAAGIGFEEAAAQLIRRGAKIDGVNRRGETALAVAVQQRQPRLVELLLRAGANPDKGDHVTGYTPRDYAKRDTRNPQLLKLIETIKPAGKKAVAGPKIN